MIFLKSSGVVSAGRSLNASSFGAKMVANAIVFKFSVNPTVVRAFSNSMNFVAFSSTSIKFPVFSIGGSGDNKMASTS